MILTNHPDMVTLLNYTNNLEVPSHFYLMDRKGTSSYDK
jgi:hypothetical protein